MSILKPLKGVDEGLRENLESFFRLDYPQYEILFSVADAADAADPACHLVEGLMARYPRVRARLVVGGVDIGPNPKVNNLVRSYESAAHDLILVSDSNVRVGPDYLKRKVAHLDNGVGIVTAVVAGTGARTAGGMLESMYLNTFYARGMYLAAAFRQPCVVGKSMLFSRTTAARFGGIRALGRYLAEDYMAGIAMRRLGLSVVLMSDPIRQHVGRYAVRDFWARHLRWGRIRKAQAPLAFLAEPLAGPIVSGALGAWALWAGLGLSPALCLPVHLAIWSLCDLWLARRLDPESGPMLPLVWLVRELLALPMWAHTALGNTVLWRGRRLGLLPGGLLAAPVTGNS